MYMSAFIVEEALHIKSENAPVMPFLHTNTAYITGMTGIPPTLCAKPVEDITINSIVTWLAREVATNRHFTLDRLAHEYDIDLPHVTDFVDRPQSDTWAEKLANAMFQLNCDGVTARYGTGEAEKFRPLNFRYQPEICYSRVQVLKSLQCWMYQCCEGDVPKTKLYRFFEEVENYLALKIVMNLPEYDKAKWG